MIEFKNITKTYRTGKIAFNALSGVNLKIEPGEFVAIMGPSGSGKSTLLHIMGLLDRPDSGEFFFNRKDVTKLTDDELAVVRNQSLGFVFQQFHLLPRLTAVENIALPLIYAGRRHLVENAKEKLKAVGLAERGSHYPNELSGGEQQRIAIARSLINEPPVILADEPTGNLDTKSEEEIITILKNLNKQGKTVVMITHENEVAEHAKRIIRMRDGKIISDEIKVPLTTPVCAASECKNNVSESSSMPIGNAEFKDHLRQSIQSIISHKMRSMLSMLGIFIGVAAVIAMLALGEGAKEAIAERLSALGSNLLTIRSGSSHLHGVAMEAGSVTRFTLQDAEAISQLSLIKLISPNVNGRGQIVYGNKNWSTQVQGVGENYDEIRASVPTKGKFITKEELIGRQKVAVIGVTVARELFGDMEPVDEMIKINSINFRVIGVLPEKGATGWRDNDDIILIPVTTGMYRLFGKEYVDSIDAEVRDGSKMEEAQDMIKKLIIKRHKIVKKDDDSFQIRNMAEIQQTMQSTTQTLAWLLGSISTISLLVGGIGIMNIMLVSVTERTKEIGLRKAIGARKMDIMSQFLIESIVMTSLGGILGIMLGCGVSFLLASLADWNTKISAFSIILSTSFSIAIGMGFGIWPARQAAKLNPVEALRYE
ncbi:MAG: ABC transporter permease [Candidatus Firestonebacteria bacterium]|nr:ABC transporter permease [Candidatus Firestonebacteria bacterium]